MQRCEASATSASGQEQGTNPQRDELRATGCSAILKEHASGADRGRPVLARLLRDIPSVEALVVVRLDRLARSVIHLLAVIEGSKPAAHTSVPCAPRSISRRRRAYSRCRCWAPSPKLEQALIEERTKAGFRATHARGRISGDPGLRTGDPAMIRNLWASRDAKHLNHGQQASPAKPEVCTWTVKKFCQTVRY